MKRSKTLAEIKQRGYHNDPDGAAFIIQARKNIGSAAARKAYLDGTWDKAHGRPCRCPKCTDARGGGKQ